MALSGSLNFLTASITGSADIKLDFVGLNTLIIDPVTGSTNQLGHLGTEGHPDDGEAYYNNSIQPMPGPKPNQLNFLLLNRNGPYQHPSWKQLRGGDHPVARKQRLYNTMSVDFNDPDAVRREVTKKVIRHYLEGSTLREEEEFYKSLNSTFTFTGENTLAEVISPFKEDRLKQYYEPPVAKNHKPFMYDVDFSSELLGVQHAVVKSSLMNQMTFFENKELNQILKIPGTSRITGTMTSRFLPRKQQYYDFIVTAKELNAHRFRYSQTIFPKSINTFRAFTTTISEYDELPGLASNGYDRTVNRSFWKNQQADTLSLEDDYFTGGGTYGAAKSLLFFNGILPKNTASQDGATRTRTDNTAFSALDVQQRTSTEELWNNFLSRSWWYCHARRCGSWFPFF